MDPQAISDVAGGDAGTKKKSSFQITSVRKGDTASLSSDVVGAIDEFDVDADEGEADGDEEEDNLSGSVSLDQPNENGHLADTGLAAPDVPQSQSKYRVVRIKKFHRGRWNCWDFVNKNGGEQTHSPGDAQNQEEEQSRKNSRKPSDITVEEPPSDNAVNHDESKRNPSAPATGGESSTSTGSRPSGSGKKVAFGPVATATAVATTGAATAAEDTTPSQSNGASRSPASATVQGRGRYRLKEHDHTDTTHCTPPSCLAVSKKEQIPGRRLCVHATRMCWTSALPTRTSLCCTPSRRTSLRPARKKSCNCKRRRRSAWMSL
eukprot:scpid51811/ scgid1216/ 